MSPGRGPKASRFSTCRARSCSERIAAEAWLLFAFTFTSPAHPGIEDKTTRAIGPSTEMRLFREGEIAELMMRILSPLQWKCWRLPDALVASIRHRSVRMQWLH